MLSVTNASIVQIGDVRTLRPYSRALAVQREISFFLGNEGHFGDFPLFWVPIPEPLPLSNVRLNVVNENPVIQVANLQVTAAASSSVVKLGHACVVDAEARLLHIRQLQSGERPVGLPDDLEE